MKVAVRARTDAELGQKIDVSKTTISSWRSRGSIPFDVCLQIAEERQVSLDWLICGVLTLDSGFRLEPLPSDPAVDFDLLTAVVRERKFELAADGTSWEADVQRARQLIAEYQRYRRLLNTASMEGVSRADFLKSLKTLIRPPE